MSDDRVQLHKLRIQRGLLEYKLREAHREAGAHWEFDAMDAAGLYCDYRLGADTEFARLANRLHLLDREIEEMDGVRSWPTWNVYRIIIEDRIKQGEFDTDDEVERAAKFLAEIEEKLASIPHPLSTMRKLATKIPPPQDPQRSTVFVSYSHRDMKWLERLRVHLKPLERAGTLRLWSDQRIRPGTDWRAALRQAMSEAQVAILLVSADFLASDFITNHELPPLLERADSQGAVLLPLIVGACRFEESSIGSLQSINPPDVPLNSLAEHRQEELLLEVSRVVEGALNLNDS